MAERTLEERVESLESTIDSLIDFSNGMKAQIEVLMKLAATYNPPSKQEVKTIPDSEVIAEMEEYGVSFEDAYNNIAERNNEQSSETTSG